jgi:amino-acid N-acetyltransferase
MDKIKAIIQTAEPAELAEVFRLLETNQLPVSDLRERQPEIMYCAKVTGKIIGFSAVEIYGTSGLLRSVAVSPEYRSHGIARQLVHQLEESARSNHIAALYLLTETAEHFFAHLGYVRTERDQAPSGIHASSEFKHLCPASAVCMMKKL